MTHVQIITPRGMFGGGADDDLIDMALRVIGVGFGEDGDWNAKYGANFENEVFLMKRYCWCDQPECDWCMHGDQPDFDARLAARFGTTDYQGHRLRRYYDPPNFWFKPDDFRVTWYKYIGRDMAANKDNVSGDFLERIFATHPRGMTAAEAIAETARQEEETAKSFSDMFAKFGVRA